MVVHGDDFIVGGCGDDLDWLSQMRNEKLELVQKARLGPGYDSDATVLNRCVTYSDSGLTWEADPRHAELAAAELGLQSARPQTSPGGAKPSTHLTTKTWNLTGRKPTTACQQDWHIWQQADLTSHSPARNAAVQLERQPVLTSHVLKRIGRHLLHTPRAVWEFPLQTEERIVTIDGLSDADAAGCTKTRRSTSGGCLRVGQHTLATWSSTQKVVSLSSAESEHRSMVRCASEAIGLADTIRELGHEAHVLDRRCSSTRAGPPQRERRHQTHGDKVLLAAAEREEPGAQDRKHPWHGQPR